MAAPSRDTIRDSAHDITELHAVSTASQPREVFVRAPSASPDQSNINAIKITALEYPEYQQTATTKVKIQLNVEVPHTRRTDTLQGRQVIQP